MGVFLFRFVVLFLVTVAGYFFPPFSLPKLAGAGVAFFLSIVIVFLETRIRKTQFKIIWGSTIGTFAGVFLGWFLGAVYQNVSDDGSTATFLRIFFLIILPYIGFLVGTLKFEWLEPGFLLRFFKEKSVGRSFKILDTSVIIDGRIADICDAAFIEGTLVVPQFILKELQLVADSSDGIKRQRGRRGLEVLDHLQKTSQVRVIISELDFPATKDVDSKLIEVAKYMDAKIVTNDFNLSKVAQLQGVPILNINELANALKPVVLPGETMRVFILKEGKEKDQGVAYLDDGTMVVCDNARKMIGQTIDVTVTSVLQTTVGKMIFGRYNE
ncbi:MAG: TRAM domain-containing protein [Acidobacteria bacterium]|nr:TRAM domain-containing protein [Acidobacteriota bacterium]MCG2816763.1 TRAM domain-containing protein [Candidatus Aminicenantes bacterium]MBU1338746.1 TRAM domain-containing protein [Acidobacteriota bacterium]MBU1474461.1 TRAM domain-containing protein [Acidobacteriota bacterium]MBU2438997.1 TRAM domain-containing protein [Acidobacteriota bacterium]